MKSKFWILISVLVIVGMVLSACAKPTPTPKPVEKPTAKPAEVPATEPIKIAILAPLSGDVKTFGESTRDGALMAFEEWNAKGGVLGQPIEIIIGDSKCDAQEAANAANKVIFEDGVKYIVGAVCSSASIPISEIAEAEGVLQISPTSTNPAVSINEDGSNKEYVFRACFLDPFQGEVVAALAMELGAKTSAVLYDVGNDYVKGLAEYYKAAFESMGGTVPVFEAYTKEDTDFSAILTKVAAANPDALFLPDYYSKNNLIAAQVQEKGIKALLLGGDGWDSPELDLPLFEGGYHSNHYSPADPRPLVQNFVQAYTAKYGAEPDALATLAYDAAHILCQSIENAGVDDPAAVKDAMAALQFEGVSGEITFDDHGDPVKKAAIIKVEGGKKVFYKFVAPAAPAATVAEAPGFPVKIAILAPLSGDVKTFGESTRDGALMAFEEATAAGWDIDIIIGDSKCDAQEAANAANKVIFEDGVKYIVGAVCSSASIPISEIAEAEGVLQISPTSTNPAVTINEDGSNKEYVFRACFLDPFQGEVVAALAMELGAKTSAVLYDVGNDYVKGLAEYYKAAFESMGGTVPVFEAYTKEDTDFSAILTKVAAANPDALFLPDYYSKNNLIAAQIKEKGITAQLLGGDGWDSPELDMPLFEGGYHSNHYSPADPRPVVQNFVQAYTAKYGAEPDALATLAYDAAKILLQAISEAGVDDPAVVKDKMSALQFEGVSGDITFDERGDPVKKAAIIKVEGGKKVFYKFVAPAGPAPEKKAFVIGTDATWPPMEFVDESKDIVGFDIDMMNAIAEAVGIEVEFKNVSWDGIFAGLEAGEYDAILSCVTITDERKEVYDFSDPYLNAGQTVVVRAGETRISSHEDLSGMIAGAQIGTTGAFAIEKISGATLREYDTIDLAFFDLLNNNIDAVVADAPVAADYALVSDQFKGKLQVAGEAFTDEYLGLVVRKGDTALVSKFNEGLEKIKASGQYDELYKKWIAGEPAPAGAAVAPPPSFPVKIAILAPLSGDVKTFGESTRDGALMAFEEATAAGWDIDIIIGDSKCDAQEAANAANKVIFEDGVKYIVGAVCSSASIPISEIAEAEGVLQISPTSTNPAVTINEDGSNKEYVFRACFLDPFQGEVVAALAMELGAKTSAVLYDVGNDYVKGLAEYYKAAFESMGGTVPVFEAYTKEDTDFSAILTKVAAANPDALFLPDYYSKNNLIAAQVQEKGIKALLLGGDGWDSPELDMPLFEGGYHSNHYSPADPRPVVQNFVQAYTAKYGAEPDALATLAYDAAKILLQAISEAGVDDPAVVKDKMSALQFEGVSGEITFDERGDPVKKAAIIKVEGGKKVFYKFVAP